VTAAPEPFTAYRVPGTGDIAWKDRGSVRYARGVSVVVLEPHEVRKLTQFLPFDPAVRALSLAMGAE
jgi:hypothetical protein